MSKSRLDETSAGISFSEHPIRLVAIDLDGTLLNSAKQISARTAGALKCLPKQNVRVVIASARPPRSVRHIYAQLGLDTLQINYNGALVWDERKRRAVFHRPIPCKVARQMIESARDLFEEVIVSCEIMDKLYTDRQDDRYATETSRLFKPDLVGPIDDFCTVDITKLLLQGDPRILARIEPMLLEQFGREVTIIHADEDLLQIMEKRVGKAVALKKVAGGYGVRPEEIMAIGDALNDVGMLQLAGVAVAMDNAHKVVKQNADWIAPSNDDHGVHAALVRYGLCGS